MAVPELTAMRCLWTAAKHSKELAEDLTQMATNAMSVNTNISTALQEFQDLFDLEPWSQACEDELIRMEAADAAKTELFEAKPNAPKETSSASASAPLATTCPMMEPL